MKLNAFIGILIFLSVLIACNMSPAEQQAAVAADTAPDSATLIKKGEYLVTISGCGDCHNPKVMTARGPAPEPGALLSGYNSSRPFTGFDKAAAFSGKAAMFNMENTAFAGPWGVSYAANLTPDETGIGNWSLEQFRTAMTQGKWKGLPNTRPLLPPMPWQNYTNMKAEDISAIFAYLKSLKPVKNLVPSPVSPAAL